MNIESKNKRVNADQILAHGVVVTVDKQRRIFKNGSIAIKKDIIIGIGPYKEIEKIYYSDKIVNLQGALVHPGYVNGHFHTSYGILRGTQPDSYYQPEVAKKIFTPFYNGLTPREEYYSTLLACMEMIQNGITAFADTGSTFSNEGLKKEIEAIKLIRIRGFIGRLVSEEQRIKEQMVSQLNMQTDACIEIIEEQLQNYPHNEKSRVWCIAGIASLLCSDKLLKKTKELSEKYKVQMFIHQSVALPGENEIKLWKLRTGKYPIEHFNDLCILGPNLTLVHMNEVYKQEIELLGKTNTRIISNIACGMKLAIGINKISRIPEMLRNNITIGLGVDTPNVSNAIDIGLQAYLAAIIFKDFRQELPTITAETAVEMATINGAKALGLENEIGSLEVGKKADIIIHDINVPEAYPLLNPINDLIYTIISKRIDSVLIGGEFILKNKHFAMIEEKEIYKEIKRIGQKVGARIGMPLEKRWPIIE